MGPSPSPAYQKNSHLVLTGRILLLSLAPGNAKGQKLLSVAFRKTISCTRWASQHDLIECQAKYFLSILAMGIREGSVSITCGAKRFAGVMLTELPSAAFTAPLHMKAGHTASWSDLCCGLHGH